MATLKKATTDLFLGHLDEIAKAFTVIAKAIGFIADHPIPFLAALAGGGLAKGVGAAAGGVGGLQAATAAATGGGGGGGPVLSAYQLAATGAKNPGLGAFLAGSGAGVPGFRTTADAERSARRWEAAGTYAQAAGVALQRATLTLAAVAETDMSPWSKGALTFGAALSAIPGPLGFLASAATAAAAALGPLIEKLGITNKEQEETAVTSNVADYAKVMNDPNASQADRLRAARQIVANARDVGALKGRGPSAQIDTSKIHVAGEGMQTPEMFKRGFGWSTAADEAATAKQAQIENMRAALELVRAQQPDWLNQQQGRAASPDIAAAIRDGFKQVGMEVKTEDGQTKVAIRQKQRGH